MWYWLCEWLDGKVGHTAQDKHDAHSWQCYLVFLGTHPLGIIKTPPSEHVGEAVLHQSYFDLYRQDWRNVEIDPGVIEFNLIHSAWLKLFRETGFTVASYQQLGSLEDSGETKFSTPAAWAQRWPCELVWHLRKD